MAKAFTLLIIESDGDRYYVENVTRYGYYKEADIFYFVKNGFEQYLPKEGVFFIGRKEDFENEV